MAKKKAATKVELAPADYEPLLVAISSSSVDTCLLGAQCLALLEDPRAFGLLMQLSRDQNEAVRFESCRSLARLGDRRAVDRLCAMLADPDLKVRDEAFSALDKICTQDPLLVVEQGFACSFEDIHLRALERLVRFMKDASKSKRLPEKVSELLLVAINDSYVLVRFEAFKFALNSKFNGGEDSTLRYLLGCIHADVRREVWNEVMAEDSQLWSETMMFEMLDDPDEGIRRDVFGFLKKKYQKKEKQTGWLSAGITSQHADIRELVCNHLAKLNTMSGQKLLASAINDSEQSVRKIALHSLIDRQATDALVAALDSQHVEVKLSAARALSQMGDQRAMPVLEEAINQPYPLDSEEQQTVWKSIVVSAIESIGHLGDPAPLARIIELCRDKNEDVSTAAAKSLRWLVREDSVEQVRALLSHAGIRDQVALACGLYGDPVSERTVLTNADDCQLNLDQRMQVAVAMGERGETQLVAMLDQPQQIPTTNVGMLVLLCRDWLQHDGTARRVIASLAVQDTRLRMYAARALRAFGDDQAMSDVIQDMFNSRGESNEPFKIETSVVRQVAEALVFGQPPFQCKVLSHLQTLVRPEQKHWDFGWQQICGRYAEELKEATQQASKLKLPKLESDQETRDQLAFGTYVGLARDYDLGRFGGFGWHVVSVSHAALRCLRDMALNIKDGKAGKKSELFYDATVQVMTHATGDSRFAVGELAFEILAELGVSDRDRAEIGIHCGDLNRAVEGLNLLIKSAKAAERKEILISTVLNQPADVALAAASMLNDDAGSVVACETCLQCSHEKVATAGVAYLSRDCPDKPAAKKLLQKIANDAPAAMRKQAVAALVHHRDKLAFDAIENLLNEPTANADLQVCLNWLGELGDERTCEFLVGLLDRSELDRKLVLNSIGRLNDPAAVPKLLELMEHAKTNEEAAVVYQISGFDQYIADPNDTWPDRDWMKGQRERDGDVLAKLLHRSVELGNVRFCNTLIDSVRWCLTDEVNTPLAGLVEHPDESLRRAAISAIGFRAEKRDGSVDSLRPAVSHRDPMTQFLAAEGLARAGQSDGLQVLMTSVEMMEDLRLRRRAVSALGYLADERALDLLLNLVNHDGHALQDSAAEAIGHLGQTSQREKIFGILRSLVGHEGTAGQRAVVGLRHLDYGPAWDLIRLQTKKEHLSNMRLVALEQLGYDTSETTQGILLDSLKNVIDIREIQFDAARRSFGDDSIEPDLALLAGVNGRMDSPLVNVALDRVCQNADAEKIFELVSDCSDHARKRLANHLLSLDPLPAAQAAKALEGVDENAVELAAHVIGRPGDKKYAKAIGKTLQHWLDQFVVADQQVIFLDQSGRGSHAERQRVKRSLQTLRESRRTLQRLLWAAGRVGGCEKVLLSVVTDHASNLKFADLRTQAMESLIGGKLTAAMEKQVKELLDDYTPEVRRLASQLLLEQPKTKPDSIGSSVLADRKSFEQLAASHADQIESTIQTAAASSHYQPRALPQLLRASDSRTLASVATDAKSDFNTRLGALEGLAAMNNKAAEKALVSIGNDKSCDEELRKAAWRGLRRSKRNTK